jgi:hypothetical protein
MFPIIASKKRGGYFIQIKEWISPKRRGSNVIIALKIDQKYYNLLEVQASNKLILLKNNLHRIISNLYQNINAKLQRIYFHIVDLNGRIF